MICFNNDYSEGAHPAILRALEEENLRQKPVNHRIREDFCERLFDLFGAEPARLQVIGSAGGTARRQRRGSANWRNAPRRMCTFWSAAPPATSSA